MRRGAFLLGVVVVAVPLAGCAKLRGHSKASVAAASASASASAAAAAASASAAAASSAAAAAASVRAAEAAAAASAAASAHAKQVVADLKWMVAHNVTSDPAKAGEGDASSKCDEVTSLQKKAASAPVDPEVKASLDEGADLCAFDVPLTTASEAITGLNQHPSQASRRLMCDVATREVDRARAVKAKDPKLLKVDARRREACNR